MAGLNSEISHEGSVYHVQTQDVGASAHYVESVIYKSGRVLTSRRSDYSHLLNQGGLQEKITTLIKSQHEAILKDIAAGKFDHL